MSGKVPSQKIEIGITQGIVLESEKHFITHHLYNVGSLHRVIIYKDDDIDKMMEIALQFEMAMEAYEEAMLLTENHLSS